MRSHAERGNENSSGVETRHMHSHAERGNEENPGPTPLIVAEVGKNPVARNMKYIS